MTVLSEVYGQFGNTRYQKVYNNDSLLLKSLNSDEYHDLVSGDGIMYYHHTWAVLKTTFDQSEGLKEFWKLISTSFCEDGTEFVATVESKDYPIFATQYHPEKNSYEWRIPAKRTYNSISASQKFINTFIALCKKNKNVMLEDERKKKIIYNYNPIFPDMQISFAQIYVFSEDKEIKELYGGKPYSESNLR